MNMSNKHKRIVITGGAGFIGSNLVKKYIDKKEKNLKAKLKFDISISDETPFVITFVVISLAPYV